MPGPIKNKERVVKKTVLAVLIWAAAVSHALAAGMTAHMYVAEEALGRVSDPELKSLLGSEKGAVLAGSIFPDTGNGLRALGYPAKYNYGDLTHSSYFLETYLSYAQANCRKPFDDHCRLLIAHMMGVDAHHVEDRTYHTIFMESVERIDQRHRDLDSLGDMILINSYHRAKVLPCYRVPYQDLNEIMQAMGEDVTEGRIRTGNQAHRAGLLGERLLALFQRKAARELPWMAANMYSGPGGIDYSATALARTWEALWLRLNGRGDEVKHVAAVFPEPGETAAATQDKIYILFAQPMLAKSLAGWSFTVRDREKRIVPGAVWNHGEDHGELTIYSAFAPWAPLAACASYTVHLSAEVLDLNGKPLPKEYSWSFQTSCPKP